MRLKITILDVQLHLPVASVLKEAEVWMGD